jgi:hypothetical protein
MKAISKSTILFVMMIALTSCNTFVQTPTQTPIPTATSLPTLTSTPEPTITPTRTATPTPTPVPPTQTPTKTPVPPTKTPSTLGLQMPSGTPVANWEGLPVMPNAIAGDSDATGYSFTVKASTEEIQNFYEKEMPKLGWNTLGIGQGTTNAIILIFMKGSSTVSVGIIPQSDDLVYVLLTK